VQGTRTAKVDVTPAPGTVLTKGNKGTGPQVLVVSTPDGVGYQLNGDRSHQHFGPGELIAGGARNGWTYFGLE
jgi:hypothetical protein